MLVKKTKQGRFSFELGTTEMDHMYSALVGFLETESVNCLFIKMKTEGEIMRLLYYSVLNQFALRTNFFHRNGTKRVLMERSEAIAIMWLLRGTTDIQLLNLKSAIHKQLHS